MNRRKFRLTAGLIVVVLAVVVAWLSWQRLHPVDVMLDPGDITLYPDDRILGAPEAAIIIVEFASLSCTHCASFHEETLPSIKQGWIETGKARLVYRDFPRDEAALRAAAVAMCFEKERYFDFLGLLYRTQPEWSQAEDLNAALSRLAEGAGLDPGTIGACLEDKSAMDRIIERQVEAQQKYGIRLTPSFLINGRKVEGAQEFQKFKEILEELAS